MRRTGIRTGFKGASAPWPPGMVVGGEVCYDMWIWCVARWQRRCGSPRAASGPLCASRGPPAVAAAGSWFRGPARRRPARPIRGLLLGPALLVWGRGCAGPRGVPPLRGRLGAPAPRPPKDGRNDRFVSLTGREGVCGRPRKGLLHRSDHKFSERSERSENLLRLSKRLFRQPERPPSGRPLFFAVPASPAREKTAAHLKRGAVLWYDIQRGPLPLPGRGGPAASDHGSIVLGISPPGDAG